jgi:hypothetical protein
MLKPSYLRLSAAVLGLAGLVGVEARSAELEGALQYPPPSVGQDAQPPPPAKTVPQLVTPRRIELGVSGSSPPPGTQLFMRRPTIVDLEHRRRPEADVSSVKLSPIARRWLLGTVPKRR